MRIEALLNDAERVVREAAEIARQGLGRSLLVREKERGDIVTEGDLKVEE